MSDNNIDYTKLIGTLLKNNATVQEIAQVLGVTVATAQKYVDDYKNKQTPKTDIKDKPEPKQPKQRRPSPQLWTRKKELRLYEMVQAGFSAQEIADELNVPVSLIRNKADKLKPTPQDDDDEPEQQQPTTPIKSKSRLAKTADKLKQGGQSVGRGTVRATKAVGRGAWTATKAVGRTTGRAAGNLALNVTDEAFGNIGRLFTAPLRHRLNRGRHFARSFNPRESGVENYIDGYTDGRKDAVAATKNTKADNSQLAEKIGKLSETVKASGAKIDQRLLQTLDIIKRVNFQDSNTDFARGQEKRNSSGEEEKPSLFDRFFNSGLSNKTKIAAGVGGLGILGALAYFNWDTITGNKTTNERTPTEPAESEQPDIGNEELRRLEEAAENKTKEQAIRAEGEPDSSPPQQKLKIEGRELKYKAETIKFDADEIILKQKSGISGRAGGNNNGGGGPNGDGGAGGQKGGMESVGADPPTGDAAERLNRRYNPRRGDSGGGAGTGGDKAAANAAKARDPMEQAKNILRREMPGNKFELPPDPSAGGQSGGTESVGADPPTDSARDRLLRRYNPRRGKNLPGETDGELTGGGRAAEGAGIKDRMHSMDQNAADPNAPAANFGDRFDAVKANSKADKAFSTGIEKNDDKKDGSPDFSEGGGAAYLREQRSRFDKEFEANPDLKLRAAAILDLENPGAGPAVIESLANRMAMSGRTIESGMRGGPNSFYGPARRGMVERRMEELRRNPEKLKKLYGHIDQAIKHGSNTIKGHTDQGSAGDPNYHAGGVGVNINRERFNDWGGFKGHGHSRQWRENQQREYQKAEEAFQQKKAAEAAAAQKAADDKAAGVVNPNEVNALDKDEAYNKKLLEGTSQMKVRDALTGKDRTDWITGGDPIAPPPQVPAETIDKKDEEAKAIGKQSESKADETRQFASNDDTEKGVPTMEETTYNDGFTSGKFPGLSGHDSPFSLLA